MKSPLLLIPKLAGSQIDTHATGAAVSGGGVECYESKDQDAGPTGDDKWFGQYGGGRAQEEE